MNKATEEIDQIILLGNYQKKEIGLQKLEGDMQALDVKIKELQKQKTSKKKAWEKLYNSNPAQMDLFSGTADDIINSLMPEQDDE